MLLLFASLVPPRMRLCQEATQRYALISPFVSSRMSDELATEAVAYRIDSRNPDNIEFRVRLSPLSSSGALYAFEPTEHQILACQRMHMYGLVRKPPFAFPSGLDSKHAPPRGTCTISAAPSE